MKRTRKIFDSQNNRHIADNWYAMNNWTMHRYCTYHITDTYYREITFIQIFRITEHTQLHLSCEFLWKENHVSYCQHDFRFIKVIIFVNVLCSWILVELFVVFHSSCIRNSVNLPSHNVTHNMSTTWEIFFIYREVTAIFGKCYDGWLSLNGHIRILMNDSGNTTLQAFSTFVFPQSLCNVKFTITENLHCTIFQTTENWSFFEWKWLSWLYS